jgi:hypothetical protein
MSIGIELSSNTMAYDSVLIESGFRSQPLLNRHHDEERRVSGEGSGCRRSCFSERYTCIDFDSASSMVDVKVRSEYTILFPPSFLPEWERPSTHAKPLAPKLSFLTNLLTHS